MKQYVKDGIIRVSRNGRLFGWLDPETWLIYRERGCYTVMEVTRGLILETDLLGNYQYVGKEKMTRYEYIGFFPEIAKRVALAYANRKFGYKYTLEELEQLRRR